MRRRAPIAGLALVLMLALGTIVGCQPTLMTETGVVTSVQSTSLVDVDGFQLRTNDGRTIDFSTKGLAYGQGFPAQHLREHQALGSPVQVTYKVTDGTNVVVKLQDAPATR